MHEYFFANYRLLVDDKVFNHESSKRLDNFKKSMPYTHTFSLYLGDYNLLDEKYDEASNYPMLCKTERFTIHDTEKGWAFVSVLDKNTEKFNNKNVLLCSKDYSEMTIYVSNKEYFVDILNKWYMPEIQFSASIRAACEAGIVTRDGLPLHAALVEKDGYGIVFLGPSGMGKSTQAKLWQNYQNADFIIGDRPAVRLIDGIWYGYGMPWDGKDAIYNQKTVPIKAFVSLKQAKDNKIKKLNKQEAMVVLLNQAMLPMWDDEATKSSLELMNKMVDLPFYCLENKADEEATILTYNTVFKGEK